MAGRRTRIGRGGWVVGLLVLGLGVLWACGGGRALAASGRAPGAGNRVGGYVFLDADGDLGRDAGEPGVGAAGVMVTHTLSSAVVTATADVTGHYLVEGLLAGAYRVAPLPPAGYACAVAGCAITVTVADAWDTLADLPLWADETPPTATSTATATPTSQPSPTSTSTATASPTPTAQPTATWTATPSATPTAPPLPTSTATATPLPSATPTLPPPSLAVWPLDGPPGTVFSFSGAGFGAGESVSAWLVRPDGSASGIPGCTSSAAGALGLAFVAPPELPPGLYTVRVRGTASGREAGASFYIQAGPLVVTATPTRTAASPTPGGSGGGVTPWAATTPTADAALLLAGLPVQAGGAPLPATGQGLTPWRLALPGLAALALTLGWVLFRTRKEQHGQ